MTEAHLTYKYGSNDARRSLNRLADIEKQLKAGGVCTIVLRF